MCLTWLQLWLHHLQLDLTYDFRRAIRFYMCFNRLHIRERREERSQVAVLTIVLQGLLAIMFLMAGLGKIMGSKTHVDGFNHWRLPQWFRIVTGIVEFAGAAALVIGYWEPSWIAAGALLLAVTAIGGVLVHRRVRDSFKQTFPIVMLGVLSVIVFVLAVSDFSDFPGFA
jgi:putative oxidoreductase